MGNQSSAKKTFKGQGQSLDGTTKVQGGGKGKKDRIIKQTPPPTSQQQQQQQKPKPKNDPQAAAELRARQLEAADKRGKEWEKRLEKQRENRNKAKEQEQEQDNNAKSAGGGTAANSAIEQLNQIDNKELKQRLDHDARKLEQSGFNVFQSVSATSAQARTAVTLDGLSISPEKVKEVPPQPIDTDATNSLANQLLDEGIESSNIEKLTGAIEIASSSSDPLVQEKLKTAVDLRRALLLSADGIDSPQTPQQVPASVDLPSAESAAAQIDKIATIATVDPASARVTIKALYKVLENIKTNPDEEKYRRLRLTNPSIQTKFVAFAEGAPLQILKMLGFREEGEFLTLKKEDSQLFLIQYDGTKAALDNLSLQLTPNEE